MAKHNVNYFSHDGNAHEDPKMVQLIFKYQYKGVGLFRTIVELLFNEGGYLQYDKEMLQFCLRYSETDFDEILSFMFEVGLLKFVDKEQTAFCSHSLLRRIDKKNELTEIRKNAGSNGGLAKASSKSVAKVQQNGSKLDSKSVALKENEKKEKESKLKLEDEDFFNFSLDSFGEKTTPQVPAAPPPGQPTPAGFDEFRDYYPKKIKKAHAILSYKRAVLIATPGEIIDGASRYKRNIKATATEEKFVTSPNDWLDQERRTDVYKTDPVVKQADVVVEKVVEMTDEQRKIAKQKYEQMRNNLRSKVTND